MSGGYSKAMVELVVERRFLSDRGIRQLLREDSVDVRALIASNQNVRAEFLMPLYNDPNQSRRVLTGLANNPHLSQHVLVDLHENRGVHIASYTFNPNYPPSIKKRIMDGDDEYYKEWLRETLSGRNKR